MPGALQHREVEWERSACTDGWWIGDLEGDELHRVSGTRGPKGRETAGRAGERGGVFQEGLWDGSGLGGEGDMGNHRGPVTFLLYQALLWHV